MFPFHQSEANGGQKWKGMFSPLFLFSQFRYATYMIADIIKFVIDI